MATGKRPVDEERLPWLEPYREPAAAARLKNLERRGARLLIGGVATIAAALGAGYYVGQRDGMPGAEPSIVARVPALVSPAAPPARVQPPAAKAPAPVQLVARAPRPSSRRAVPQHEVRVAVAANRPVRIHRQRPVRSQSAIVPAFVPQAARQRPKMPSPGPAGQVVQLGAFRTKGRAVAAYQRRLARYPMLGSMPRVVVPIITKPRGQVLYVLRLGTSSRQQSGIVCRNLKVSGDHCIVIG